jgi:hypothetical protein
VVSVPTREFLLANMVAEESQLSRILLSGNYVDLVIKKKLKEETNIRILYYSYRRKLLLIASLRTLSAHVAGSRRNLLQGKENLCFFLVPMFFLIRSTDFPCKHVKMYSGKLP